jgi:Tfp pilus assembly protein PilF
MARIFAVTMLLVGFVAGCATMERSQDMQLVTDGFGKIEQQDWTGAEADLSRALEINPSNAYAQLNLGVVYQNTGRVELARQMYDKVIAGHVDETAAKSTDPAQQGKTLAEIARQNIELLP